MMGASIWSALGPRRRGGDDITISARHIGELAAAARRFARVVFARVVFGAPRLMIPSRAMAKSPCPVTKTQFLDKAEPVKITIGNAEIIADKREFSTGSFGWYYNGKTTVTVDGKPLSVQVGLNLTVVGSKEAER